MSRCRKLSTDEINCLHADIQYRIELQHALAENSNPVLEAELNVSLSVIRQIEMGAYPESTRRTVSPEKQAEILRRHQAWQLAYEAMRDYTQAAMCQRHDITPNTLHRHVWIVRRAAWNDERMVA